MTPTSRFSLLLLPAAALTLAAALYGCRSGDGSTTPAAATPAPVVVPTPKSISLRQIGRYNTGAFDQGAAEIPAYDAASKRLFVVNGADRTVDILSLANPANPVKVGTLNLAPLGAAANSVAVFNGRVAVAVEATTRTDPGRVGLFNAADGALLGSVAVGALPDMVTFTPDGRTVLVANEGEPSSYGQANSVDPEGSISVIDVSNPALPVARTAGFTAYNAQAAALRAQGVRLFGPNASVAQDFEPEYIAVAPDGRTALVTLQENNALARVDVATATVTAVLPLGYKNHNVAGQGLDPSDRDNATAIGPWPVFGMYQPDTIRSFATGGRTYYVTANEGDARDYTGFSEEVRIGTLTLDPTVFPNATALKNNAALGRLGVTRTLGDTDGDGDFDALYAFGGRSFSIHDDAGARIYDSGDAFERTIAGLTDVRFNANSTSNTADDRSDNKGPEPEALEVISLGTNSPRSFAVIGLERVGGLMVYDVTTPTAPVFVQYITNRKFAAASLATDVQQNGAADGDLAPEGLVFIPADRSPSGQPLLVAANETSGTVTVYQIDQTF